MKSFLVIIAILALVLGCTAYAGAPSFSNLEMSTEVEMCSWGGCGNIEHGSMSVSECVAHCLKNGIETTGEAVMSFAGQILPVLLAAFLGVIFIIATASFVGRKFRERGDFAKLFLEQSLQSVILLN